MYQHLGLLKILSKRGNEKRDIQKRKCVRVGFPKMSHSSLVYNSHIYYFSKFEVSILKGLLRNLNAITEWFLRDIRENYKQ